MKHQDGLRIANKLAGAGLDVTLHMQKKPDSRGNTASVMVSIPYQTQPTEIVDIGHTIFETVGFRPIWDGDSYKVED